MTTCAASGSASSPTPPRISSTIPTRCSGSRSLILDGGEKFLKKIAQRRPKNTKERAELQKNTSANRVWLYDPSCPNGCKEGIVEVLDYADDPNPTMRHFKSSVECECVTKEFSEGAKA